jgi:MFS family permease
VVNALAVTAGINVVVNAAIDLVSVAGRDSVPMWGPPLVGPSILWTVIGTLFLLPLFTCVLTTTAIRKDVRRGSLPPLDRLDPAHRWLTELPPGRWRRGAEIGGLAVAILTPPVLLMLAFLGFPDLDRGQYVAWQTAFAVVLGMIVTPPIALAAMADPHPGAPRVTD